MDETSVFKYSYKAIQQHTASLAVENVGYQSCAANEGWGPGIRHHFLIHHVVRGSGTFTIYGKEYAIKEKETFLAYPNTTIEYRADEQDPWEYYWVGFNGSDAPLLIEQTDFSKQTPVLTTDFGQKLKHQLLDIYACRGNAGFEGARMTGRLYLMLSYLIENSAKDLDDNTRSKEYVRRAVAFIAGNFQNPITVEDVAKSVGLSRSHLYRVFIQNTGMSPVQYIMDVRVQNAKALLSSGKFSVKEVACSVGIEDPLYFSKAFKSATDLSPSEYMKRKSR